jgi:hypothetical protein
MNRATKWMFFAGAALAFCIPAGSAQAQVQHLPLSSFVDAQEIFEAGVWLDPASGNLLVIDIFGKRSELFDLNLPPSNAGSVDIRNLGNGTEQVTVNMHTSEAACWGFDVDFNLAFGNNPARIARGEPASFGDAHTLIVFTQPAGASFPTLADIGAPGSGTAFVSVGTSVTCRGELRAATGFPDGTPGFAHTTQRALLQTGVPGGCPPEKDGDCFPAEKVEFKPNGR